MKKTNLFISSFVALTFIGCGASGTLDSTNSETSNSTNSTSVTVERGPIYGATVTDANNQIAKNINSSSQNTYVFDESPVYPISVTGGYIDVNNDNIIDTNDLALNVTLNSYSNIISPLTTFIANDTAKLDFLKNTYGLSEDDIKNNVPSSISSKTIILSNAIYKLLTNSSDLSTTNLSTEYANVESVYDSSFTGITDLSILSTSLEEDTITNLAISKLSADDVTKANEKLWGDKYIESLTLTNSTFSKTKKTTDDVSDIWNIGLDIPADQTVSDFDIAMHFEKASGAIGNIVIQNISISNNQLSAAKKVYVFGKNSVNSTSSSSYDETKDITKNAVALLQGKLLVDLGYIISQQEESIKEKFIQVADYDVTLYITKLDTSNVKTIADEDIQVSYDDKITIPLDSQKISGTISVGEGD